MASHNTRTQHTNTTHEQRLETAEEHLFLFNAMLLKTQIILSSLSDDSEVAGCLAEGWVKAVG